MRSLTLLLLTLALGLAILSLLHTPEDPADVRLVDGSLDAAPESATDDVVRLPPRTLADEAAASRVPVAPDVAPAASDTSLYGLVVDPAGRPIESARVSAVDAAPTYSDGAGRFFLPRLDLDAPVRARKEGYVLDPRPALPAPRAGGGFEVRLVLFRGAGVEVTVTGADGRPRAGERVNARLLQDPDTLLTIAFWKIRGVGLAGVSARTDDLGRAVLEDLPAGLELALDVGRARTLCAVDASGGLTSDAEGGAPLVLAAGELRALEYRSVEGAVLRGRVLGPDGEPFARATLLLRSSESTSRHKGICDERGAFELALPAARGDTLALCAYEESPERARFTPPGAVSASEIREVHWPPAEEGEELELRLRPLGSLRGRVVDAAGAPLPYAQVTLVRADGNAAPLRCLDGSTPATRTLRDGTFRFAGDSALRAHTVDVEVAHSRAGLAVVRDVATRPGAPQSGEELVVVLAAAPPALVTCVTTSTVPTKSVQVHWMRLVPDAGAHPPVSPLPRELTVSTPGAWPFPLLASANGREPVRTEFGGVTFMVSDDTSQKSVPAGLYWIGAFVMPSGAHEPFPISTELVSIAPGGEHLVRFELSPSATLEGRVAAGQREGALHLRVTTPAGRALPLPTARGFVECMPLHPDGGFRVPVLPAGELVVQVGTRSGLQAGRTLLERRVTLEPGETRTVEW